MQQSILENLINSLDYALKKDILIDIPIDGFNQFGNEPARVVSIAIDKYNKKLAKESQKTNVLYLNCNTYKSNNYSELPVLVAFILEMLDEDITLELNKTLIKSLAIGTIKGVFDIFGGAALHTMTNGLSSVATNTLATTLVEHTTNTLNPLFDKLAEKVIETPIEILSDSITASINKVNMDVSGKIHLSPASIQEIKKIILELQNKTSYAESFELIMRLIYVISIEHPKLIIINNPNKLDNVSIALISKYFSVVKNLLNDDKYGTSFMYINSKNELDILKEQKLFLQRYNLLKILDSDIPYLAVKSSLFIGRESEKNILLDKTISIINGNSQKHLTYIIGNPGIGKTTLYNEHLREIFDKNVLNKEQKELDGIIRLSLYNEPGRTSVGLSSFIASIYNEYTRLEIAFLEHANWVDKNITNKKAEDIIDLIPFAKDVKNIGKALKDRLSYKDKSSQENIAQSFQYKQQISLEMHFKNIFQSLLDLQKISNKITDNIFSPFIIFVDDLQWIDENTSNFIIDYLINNQELHFHIISTLREEDSKDIYYKLESQRENNKNKLALIENSGVIDERIINLLNNELISKIKLEGFDEALLYELISKTIKDEYSSNKQQILSNAIMNFLGEGDKVTTLYGVETINILCDEKFYSYHNSNKLIIVKEMGVYFENFEDREFEIILKKLLTNLKENYKNSYSQGKGFTLASHAVLEERLRLIESYFKKIGSSVVFSIIVSSAISSPFDKDILKILLNSISRDKQLSILNEKFTDILLLQDYHIDIIENIYKMIYCEHLTQYKYSHSLLEIFFDSKLEQLLNDLDNKTKQRFYAIVIEAVELYESVNYNKFEFKDFLVDEKLISKKYYIEYIRLINIKKILKYTKDDLYDYWFNNYIETSQKLFYIEIINADYKQVEARLLELINQLKEQLLYRKAFLNACINIMKLYDLTGQFEKIIDISNELNTLITDWSQFQDEYFQVTNYKSVYYWRIGNNNEAIKIVSNLITTIEQYYKDNQNTISTEHRDILLNSYYIIAREYSYFGNYELAFYYYDKAIEYAEQNGDKTIQSHVLIDKADDLMNLEQYQKATALANEALVLRNEIGDNNTVFILLTFGRIALRTERYSEAKKYLYEAIEQSELISSDTHLPTIYADLALAYINFDDFENSEIYLNKALKIATTKREIFDLGYIYRIYGIYYQKISNFTLSVEYFSKSIDTFKDSGYEHYEMISKKYLYNVISNYSSELKNEINNYFQKIKSFTC